MPEAALHYFKETQNEPVLFYCLINLTEIEWSEGNYASAERYGQEAVTVLNVQNSFQVSYFYYYVRLGRLALTCGDLAGARQNLKAMLPYVKAEVGVMHRDLVLVLDALAVWCAAMGNMTLAIQVFGAEEEMYQRFAPIMVRRRLQRARLRPGSCPSGAGRGRLRSMLAGRSGSHLVAGV